MLGVRTESAWMPDWYPLIRAARYLKVPPWDLLKQSVWWRDIALIAMSAEDEAEKTRKDHKL